MDDAILAKTYLPAFKECSQKYESCSYLGEINAVGCTCTLFYIMYIKPLNMKINECKDVSQSDYEILIKPGYEDREEDLDKLAIAGKFCRLLSPEKKKQALGKSDLPKKLIEPRRSAPFKICMCATDKCDPRIPRKENTSTVMPETSIKPNQGSTKKDGSNNGGSNGSNNGGSTGSNNGGSNGSNNNKKSTTTKNSAMMPFVEQRLVITLIMKIIISFIFNNIL